MRPIHRLLGAALVTVAALLFAAAPAAAHTGFESSDPADGATLSEPLHTVTVVFTGEAEPTGAGFEILQPNGVRRAPTAANTADGRTWVLDFDPPLHGGVVGVRWTVRAPDAHPIEGSFSFTVPDLPPSIEPLPEAETEVAPSSEPPDRESAADVDVEDIEAFLDTSGDPIASARRSGAAARTITLIGTLVGVGALVFAGLVLRGHHRDVTKVLYWVRRAGILVLLGASVELVAQIAVEGGDWSALWSPSAIGSTIASPFGIAVALRIVGGLALASGARFDIAPAEHAPDPVVAIKELVGVGAGPSPSTVTTSPTGRPPGGEPYVHHGDKAWLPTVDSSGAAAGGAVALVASHLFDGHTVSKGDRLWTAVANTVHVTGGAVWVGGVLMLMAVLWRRHRDGRELRALQLAVRFSVVASIALVAVAGAGVALTVIVLDSPSELWATEWGRTLIAKMIFVVAAASCGGYNHSVLIPELLHAPDDPVLSQRLRRVVTAEAAALVAVLVATALLMGAAS